jgi:nicotinamide-nucleotide amidase
MVLSQDSQWSPASRIGGWSDTPTTLDRMADLLPRALLTAEVLSIGSELTVGETRDTNAGELSRWLSESGVDVLRMTALPDDLASVSEAFGDSLRRADLVVSTGGLGPTPDDLTREAIAATCDETPAVDANLETWLRALWSRRGVDFPEMNLKQAWLIPSATAIPNHGGTAPGWWVDRPDGRLIVALPGPPREMRPMWSDWVVPRLRGRGVGRDAASRTYRLTGIGESAVAELLGDALLRGRNPLVATYARADAVDVRISAVAADGRSAEDLVGIAAGPVLDALRLHVWATGQTTWAEAIGSRLAELDWTLATVEVGTAGALVGLLGELPMLLEGSVLTDDRRRIEEIAGTARDRAATDVGLAVRARRRGADTAVSVAVVTAGGVHREQRLALFGGTHGRGRAALVAASILLARLADVPEGSASRPRRSGEPRAASGATSGRGRRGRG